MPRYAGLLLLLMFALGANAQVRDRVSRVDAAEVAQGEPRYALVIGNSAYTFGSLKNPANDARAMAKALAAAGFNVRLLEDASLIGMQRAVRQWGNDLARGGIGLFYYAGHGMQVKGRNYLVPVNAEIEQEDEVEFNSLDVNQVLAKMDSAKNTVNIVILDACRNNPFARSFRASANGLAQMDAPTGTLIAFATAPGSTASDGASGDNGIYTRHLLRELPHRGLPIEQVFKRVRNGVMADTKGQQVPWESSSLRGEFAFIPGTPGPDTLSDAIAEAVRRERENNQRQMDQLIREALERQRATLEAQGARVASAAPVSTAAPPLNTRLPSRGDTWTYRLTEPKRVDGPLQRNYHVRVDAASPEWILEQYSVEGEAAGQWVHSNGAYLVHAGVSIISPYLLAFRDLSPGDSLGFIEIQDPSCARIQVFCSVEGKVIGRETIDLPSGRFETIKVKLQHSWQPGTSAGFGSIGIGGRDMTVWYSPALKRAVKISSRLSFTNRGAPIETDFDLELVGYQVK